jgi:hypothetical protein
LQGVTLADPAAGTNFFDAVCRAYKGAQKPAACA